MRNILLLAACCAMMACGCKKAEDESGANTATPQAERPNAPKQPGGAPNAGLNPNASGNPQDQVGSRMGGK